MRRPILVLALTLAGAGSAMAAGADRTDWVLVDRLVVIFEQMAQGPIKIDMVLDEQMAAAKRAKAERRIDAAFFDRYTRLLRVFKLMTIEDREGILRSIADRECVAFIRDIDGAGAPGDCSAPVLAKAIARELESLKQ